MKTIFSLASILFFIFGNSLLAQKNFEYSEIKNKHSLNIEFEKALDVFLERLNQDTLNVNNIIFDNDELSKTVFEEVAYLERSPIDSNEHIQRTLLNYYPIGGDRFMFQFATWGQSISDRKLILSWSLVAHNTPSGYRFSSPLFYNSKHWTHKRVGQIDYYFRDTLNINRAESFALKNIQFAYRFKQEARPFDFYMANNFQEIMQLVGIDFSLTNVGKIRDGWGVVGNKYIFSVMNNEDFSHDLFHFYSGTIHERAERNWVTEEGIAYSWGNAYYTQQFTGEMSDQSELVAVLKKHLASNKELDLYTLFTKHFWNDKSGVYDHMAPDFKVGRVLSSLICDEVERKKGMEGLNQLITCGNKPDRFTAFLEATEKLIGLNAQNFNERVKALLNDYGI